MDLVIRQMPLEALAQHNDVSIAFTVDRILKVQDNGLAGLALAERALPKPWVRDYDADHADGPSRWALRWNIRNWGLLFAFDADRHVGGAVIACRTDGVNMLEGRDDLAVLWDLRVRPDFRGRGVGSALFDAVCDWSGGRGLKQLKIETQNINVPACRFYAARGCRLGCINRHAYPDRPDEAMLLWYLDLDQANT